MATTEDTTERRNGTPAAAPSMPPAGTTEYVPLPEAAQRLGISVHAVRRLRRLRRAGQLQGRREETPQGYRWMILLPADGPPGAGAVPGSDAASPPDAARDIAQRGAASDEPAASRDPSRCAA